jgi:hypothetical protein
MQLGMRQQQRAGAAQRRARSSPACRALAPCAPSSSGRPARHVCLAGKLDEVSLFADSSLLGPSSASTSAAAAAAAGGVESVELKSKVRGRRRRIACAQRVRSPSHGGGANGPAPGARQARAGRTCPGYLLCRRPHCAHPPTSPPPPPLPHTPCAAASLQLGLDYAPLAQHLKEGDFRKVRGPRAARLDGGRGPREAARAPPPHRARLSWPSCPRPSPSKANPSRTADPPLSPPPRPQPTHAPPRPTTRRARC